MTTYCHEYVFTLSGLGTLVGRTFAVHRGVSVSFSTKTGRRGRADAKRRAWMRGVQGHTIMAARRMGPASQRARELTGERLLLARRWSAPRLERAARFTEHDLGPRLGAALSSTARRVQPPPPRRSRRVRRTVLAVLGVLGAVGIIGALMTRARLNHAYIEDSIEEAGTELHPQPPEAEPTDSRT